jgi:hypothetical protein
VNLDQLVDRARGVTVRTDGAEAYVRDLERWARPEPTRRAWIPWLVTGFATAAAIVVVLMWSRPAPGVVAMPVQVGDRVTIVAEPGTSYRVVAASPTETRIAVDRGSVTARLWHGATTHHLALEGGGVIATATGTVYSLSVGSTGSGVVHVDEGTVEVIDRDGVHAAPAGTSRPATAQTPDPRAARTLLALSAPVPTPPLDPPDAPAIAPDAAVEMTVAIDAAVPLPPTPHVVIDAAVVGDAPASIKEQWRLARLLRGQGKFAEAIAECNVIVDAHDATWSPIALVEALRIYLGPLADPEHAIEVADRMLREWPDHQLVGETRALRCQALAQLGRGSECAQTKP